jgi:MSHA biogenesis protein MshN
MEGSRQAGAESADYMGFLAALHQRVGHHSEAINAYTQAIKLNPQEGRSWLGMAISLEATQAGNAAGEAYQRAIDTGTLDDNLQKYVRERLAAIRKK